VSSAIAGFTIFLGLPLARLQNVSPRRKGFLNAIAIGILVFLIIDVFGHAWNSVGDVAQDTFSGKVSLGTGVPTVLALFSGLAIGLLGLVFYESRYMKKSIQQRPELEDSMVGGEGRGGGKYPHQQQVLQETNAYRLSMVIAIGIGAHNFSEGLAIGQYQEQ
jgi:ZIP family zinc transporter